MGVNGANQPNFHHHILENLAWLKNGWKWDNFKTIKWWKVYRSSIASTLTVWPQPIWKKVVTWWQIPPQHQSTYLGGPESASIEIPPLRPHFIQFSKTVLYEVNLVSQCSHLEVLLLSKFGSERGGFQLMQILGLLGMYYVLWYCVNRSQDFFTFI